MSSRIEITAMEWAKAKLRLDELVLGDRGGLAESVVNGEFGRRNRAEQLAAQNLLRICVQRMARKPRARKAKAC